MRHHRIPPKKLPKEIICILEAKLIKLSVKYTRQSKNLSFVSHYYHVYTAPIEISKLVTELKRKASQ